MPDQDPLIEKLDRLRGKFNNYIAQVKENRRFYALEFSEKIIVTDRQDLEAWVPPTARRAIDEAADHILYRPKITVGSRPTKSGSAKQDEIAAKKRKFLEAWWAHVTANQNVLGESRKILLDEGRVCIRKVIDFAAIPDLPQRENVATRAFRKAQRAFRKNMRELGANQFLWDIEVLDNVSVFEDPTNHRDPAYVYWESKILIEEAKRLFPEETEAEWWKLNDYDEVEFTEYWDHDEFVQWVDRDVAKRGTNPYSYIPIVIEDAGFGKLYKGVKPEEKYVGLSQHTHDMFVIEGRQLTTMEAVAEITGFPPAVARNWDENTQAPTGPGAVIHLEGDEGAPGAQTFNIAQWPPVPITVPQTIDYIQRLVNGTLKSDTLGGVPLPGVETATEADQQIRNATAKLSNPVGAMERLTRRLTQWVLMDVELLGVPVTLFATIDEGEVQLTPQEIGGYYALSVELRTIDEEALGLNKARFWASLARELLGLSEETAMLKGEISEDPRAEQERAAAEQAFYSEPMALARTLAAAQDAGQFRELVEAAVEARLADQGPTAAPRGGQPANVPAQTGGRDALLAAAQANRDVDQGAAAIRGGLNAPT